MAAGFAGPEVIAVAIHAESHGVVAATIAGGRFALWFRGEELETRDTIAVDVTHADGSTAEVRLEL